MNFYLALAAYLVSGTHIDFQYAPDAESMEVVMELFSLSKK